MGIAEPMMLPPETQMGNITMSLYAAERHMAFLCDVLAPDRGGTLVSEACSQVADAIRLMRTAESVYSGKSDAPQVADGDARLRPYDPATMHCSRPGNHKSYDEWYNCDYRVGGPIANDPAPDPDHAVTRVYYNAEKDEVAVYTVAGARTCEDHTIRGDSDRTVLLTDLRRIYDDEFQGIVVGAIGRMDNFRTGDPPPVLVGWGSLNNLDWQDLRYAAPWRDGIQIWRSTDPVPSFRRANGPVPATPPEPEPEPGTPLYPNPNPGSGVPQTEPPTGWFVAAPSPPQLLEIYRMDVNRKVAPEPYARFAHHFPNDAPVWVFDNCRLLPLAAGGWGLIGQVHTGGINLSELDDCVRWTDLDSICWQDVRYAIPEPYGVQISYRSPLPPDIDPNPSICARCGVRQANGHVPCVDPICPHLHGSGKADFCPNPVAA